MARDDDRPKIAPDFKQPRKTRLVGSLSADFSGEAERDLELDLDAERESHRERPALDEMEFDPLSESGKKATSPSSQSRIVGEVDLDFGDDNVSNEQATPAPSAYPVAAQGFSSSRYSISNHPSRHPSDPDLEHAIDQYPGRVDLDFNLEPEGSATSMLSAPALPNLNVPELNVPDLEIPKPKAITIRPPQGTDLAPSGSSPSSSSNARRVSRAPVLELDFDGAHNSNNGSNDSNRAGLSSSPPGAQLGGSSVRPSTSLRPLVSRSSSPKALVPAQMGGDYAFSDMELGGASRVAQLDVAIALPRADDEVGWPLGRSPFDDELDVSGEAVRLAGYGSVPTSLVGAALYALFVWRTTSSIRTRALEARTLLSRRETMRDQQLAALAEDKRASTKNQERFVAMYVQVDQLTAQLGQKSQELEAIDAQGATQLRAVEQQMTTQKARCLELEVQRDRCAQSVELQSTSLARLRAALQRLAIEERNLSARFETGDVPEAQHQFQVSELKTRSEQTAAELEVEEQSVTHLKRTLSQAEDEVGRGAAELQRLEGTLDTLMIAAEGASAEGSRALAQVRSARLQLLADIGRSIVELRGNVPVAAPVRTALLRADAQVKEAALANRTFELALDSVDSETYGRGRAIWIVAALLALGCLTYLLGSGAP